MESVTWSAVENSVVGGEIDISELSNEEVAIESVQLNFGISSASEPTEFGNDEALGPPDLSWASNHLLELAEQAEAFLDERKFNFAILFYATWIEHWLNRIIMLRAVGANMNLELATALIRSSRLDLKMGRIWTALGAPSFPRDIARQVTRVMEARNGFVHYKWPARDEAKHSAAIDHAETDARQAKATVEALVQLEDDVFFGGRTRSIQKTMQDRWRQNACDAEATTPPTEEIL